jgi:hypothetical protein
VLRDGIVKSGIECLSIWSKYVKMRQTCLATQVRAKNPDEKITEDEYV